MAEVTEATEKSAGWWRPVREAIRGTDQDYTEGGLWRAIVLLSIPMVLEMAMESVFAVVDVFFVSKLGAAATATVGLTEAMMSLVYAVAMGLSLSTTAMVARRIGEKHREEAAAAAGQAVILGVAAAAVIAGLGVYFARTLLTLMGAGAEVVRGGWMYTAVVFAGTFAVMLLFLINAIFRGAGDAAVAMKALCVANAINIILDPCLIFGWGPFPELGLTGAAVATTIGRGLGVTYQVWLLFGDASRIHLRRRHFHPNGEVLWRLFRVSLSGMGQFLIAHAAWVGLVRVVAEFGSSAVAGYTIAVRIIIMTILPAWGMANAAATLVGQNLGAGKPDRAESSVWMTGQCNMIFLGLVGVVYVVFAEPMVGMFSGEAEVARHAALCLRYISFGNLGYAWGMVMVQAFNGAGDTMTPMAINFLCYWVAQIPLAWALASQAGLGPMGVYLAIVVADAAVAVVGMIVFRRGRWKVKRI